MSVNKLYLCQVNEIEDPGSRGFVFPDIEKGRLVVVKKNGELNAWRNSCPHTGAPMEWKPDQFLDHQNEYIQCSLHGALFDTRTGECLRGPCVGKFLVEEKLVIDGLSVFWESKSFRQPD
jgi:nitrite reductase/ring-hydroxylating ferredoxin subunit